MRGVPRWHFMWLPALLWLLVAPAQATLIVSPIGEMERSYPTYSVVRTVAEFPVRTRPAHLLSNTIKQIPSVKNIDLNGKIVILNTMDVDYFDAWASSAEVKQANISAVVFVDNVKDLLGAIDTEIGYKRTIPFPVVVVAYKHAAEIQALFNATNSTIFARLDSNNLKSPWAEAHESPFLWFFVVYMAIFQIALIILCIGRLIVFLRVQRSFTVHMAVLVIFCELIGAIIRFIYWAVDPFGQRGVWKDAARKVFHTSTLPFFLVSTLLLSLYWHHVLATSKLNVTWSLTRLRIPAFVLAGLILGFEFVVDGVILSGNILRLLDMIRSVFYIIVATSLVLFFIITGIRVLRAMKELSEAVGFDSGFSKAAIQALAVKIIISALFTIGIIGVGFITVAPDFSTHWIPSLVIGNWLTIHALLTGKGILAAYALLPANPTVKSPPTGERHHSLLEVGSMSLPLSMTMHTATQMES